MIHAEQDLYKRQTIRNLSAYLPFALELTLSSMPFLTSTDGTTLYAYPPVGSPRSVSKDTKTHHIVFIHGASMSGMLFDTIFDDPKWSEECYLVRYDVRGHGRSGKPNPTDDGGEYESKRFKEDFHVVCEAFGVEEPFILAWWVLTLALNQFVTRDGCYFRSIGGLHFADILSSGVQSPIKGLINVAGLPYSSPEILETCRTAECASILQPFVYPKAVEEMQAALTEFVELLSGALVYPVKEAVLGTAFSQPRPVLAKQLTRKQDTKPFLEAGKRGDIPLLVVYGTKDRLIKGEGVAKAFQDNGWKRLRVVSVDDGDHLLWISRPKVFREVVLNWIKSVMDGQE